MNRSPTQTSRTKIVATAGPACDSLSQLRELIDAGVDVFRINTAHGTDATHQRVFDDVRQASQEAGRPVAVLVDLAGPKIRLGELPGGELVCEVGQRCTLVYGQPQAANELPHSYPQLADDVKPGNSVLMADGAVGMRVVSENDRRVVCEVIAGGRIRSRQGINLPGVQLTTPSMTDRDRDRAHWAARQGADFISLSFVRDPEDMRQLRQLIDEVGCDAQIVAKVEKREALDRIEEVVAASDAVMVARGDLGVEIDVAETPAAQKRIVQVCNQLNKPVIVATQMLDSMQHSPRPTRAEASDVANAVLDGADACMLSGETAIGQFPLAAVSMMGRIMKVTEQLLSSRGRLAELPSAASPAVQPVTAAMVAGAGDIATRLGAKLMVIATRNGVTARIRAKQRDNIPTLGVAGDMATLRRLCLYWGVIPVEGPADNGPKLREFIYRWTAEHGVAGPGDRILYVTGSGLIPLAHNLIAVHDWGDE